MICPTGLGIEITPTCLVLTTVLPRVPKPVRRQAGSEALGRPAATCLTTALLKLYALRNNPGGEFFPDSWSVGLAAADNTDSGSTIVPFWKEPWPPQRWW